MNNLAAMTRLVEQVAVGTTWCTWPTYIPAQKLRIYPYQCSSAQIAMQIPPKRSYGSGIQTLQPEISMVTYSDHIMFSPLFLALVHTSLDPRQIYSTRNNTENS